MYFASPPISNGAVRSIRLSNPQIRRLCFYPSLRATRKISRHKRALPLPPPHTRGMDTEYKRRARGWFAMFCRGSTTGSITTTSGGKRDEASDDLSVIPWITGCRLRFSALSCDSILAIISELQVSRIERERERKGTEWGEKREARRNGASQIGIGIHR